MQSKFVKSVMASLLSLALCVPESIPSSAVPPTVAPILLKEKVGNVVRTKLSFAVAQGDRVPGYLLVPAGAKDKLPAILCLHQTNGPLGSKEPAAIGHAVVVRPRAARCQSG